MSVKQRMDSTYSRSFIFALMIRREWPRDACHESLIREPPAKEDARPVPFPPLCTVALLARRLLDGPPSVEA